MQPDPTGSVAGPAAQDTAAATPPAPDTAGPTGGVSASAESPGDDAATDATPTLDPEGPTEDDGDDDEGADPADEQQPAEAQTEEQRKLSRKERQRLREQERIQQAVAEAIAAKEREAQQAAERERREAEAREARERAAKEFAEYVGEPDEDARLNAEIADLNRQIRAELAIPQGADLDALESEISKREARLADITRARGFQERLAANIWNGIEAHIYAPLQWPEFSDQATKQRYLTAQGGIAGALGVLKEVVAASTAARKDAEIAALRKAHDSEVATLREEMRGWRVRAGAEEVPETTSGAATSGGQVFTRERLARMSVAEYRQHKAEIARQEAAGLIR